MFCYPVSNGSTIIKVYLRCASKVSRPFTQRYVDPLVLRRDCRAKIIITGNFLCTQDPYLDGFFIYNSMIEHDSVPPRLVSDSNLESDFKNRILNISLGKLECLVKFLPLVLDKLLLLLVKPPVFNNFTFKNIGQAVFETLANIVKLINMVSRHKDSFTVHQVAASIK